MSRYEFLHELEMQLKPRFKKSEVSDILADYEEYFTAGVAEGKGEEVLCQSFGSPAQIAASLLDDTVASAPASTAYRLKEFAAPLFIALLMFLLVLITQDNDDLALPWFSLAMLSLLFFVCRKRKNAPPQMPTALAVGITVKSISLVITAFILNFSPLIYQMAGRSLSAANPFPPFITLISVQRLFALAALIFTALSVKKYQTAIYSVFIYELALFAGFTIIRSALHPANHTRYIMQEYGYFIIALVCLAIAVHYIQRHRLLHSFCGALPMLGLALIGAVGSALYIINSIGVYDIPIFMRSPTFRFILHTIFVLGFPVLIYYLLSPTHKGLGAIANSGNAPPKVNLLLRCFSALRIATFLAFLCVTMFTLFYLTYDNLDVSYYKVMGAPYIGSLADLFVCLVIVITTLSWLAEVTLSHGDINRFLTHSLIHCGVLATCTSFLSLLSHIDIPSQFIVPFLLCFYPLCLAVAAVVCLALVKRFCRRKVVS